MMVEEDGGRSYFNKFKNRIYTNKSRLILEYFYLATGLLISGTLSV